MSDKDSDSFRRMQAGTQGLINEEAILMKTNDLKPKKKKTKADSKGRKKVMMKIKEQMSKMQWGSDKEQYNTIVETSILIGNSFLTMQIIRMLCVMCLFCVILTYFYIYVRAALFHISFYGLLFTFLAFVCLFIGSGKQKVYQLLVDAGKIDYSNKKKKSNLWMWGVQFYTIAFPLVLTTNFMYFLPFNQLSTKFLPPRFKIHNQGFMEDINEGLEIYYAREQQNDVNGIDDHGNNGWREIFLQQVQLIPLALLTLDMLMNKIKIRWQQIKVSIFFLVIYFLITLLQQWQSGNSIYTDNLNWFGNSNRSYLVDIQSNAIRKSILNVPCNKWLSFPNQQKMHDTYKCMPFSNTYWCPVEGQVNSQNLPLYSHWNNCFLFVTTTFVLNIVFHFVVFGIHQVKLMFGGKAYRPHDRKVTVFTPK